MKQEQNITLQKTTTLRKNLQHQNSFPKTNNDKGHNKTTKQIAITETTKRTTLRKHTKTSKKTETTIIKRKNNSNNNNYDSSNNNKNSKPFKMR